MARAHGRIASSIWNDADFITLPGEPQRLYLFLCSQPDLTHAGLLPLRVRRWASKVGDGTEESVRAGLDKLADEGFIVIDDDSEELLIRTFVRNDGVYKQPKVMLRLREDAKLIESPRLRAAFRAELDRLPLHELSDKPAGQNGDLPSTRATVTAVVDALRDDFTTSSEGVSERVSDTPGDESEVPTRVRAGALPLPPTPIPQPPTPVPATPGDAASDDAAPTAQTLMAEWIDNCDKRPPARVIGQVAKEVGAMLNEGIDYADVRSGLAAWHHKGLHPSTLASVVNEVINASSRQRSQAHPPRPSTTDARVQEGMRLAAHFAELDQQLALESGDPA